MNVGELIGLLASLPPDMPILVEGFEGGLDDIRKASLESVVLRYNTLPRGTLGVWAGKSVPVESGAGAHCIAREAVEEPREAARPVVVIRRKQWEAAK